MFHAMQVKQISRHTWLLRYESKSRPWKV